MPATVYTSAVITLNAALKGYAPSNSVFNTEVTAAAAFPATLAGMAAYANTVVPSGTSNADLSALVLGNMGLLPNPDLQTALTQVFALYASDRGTIIMQLADLLSKATSDPIYGAAANAWNAASAQAYAYSSAGTSSAVPVPFMASGVTFVETLASAAGADVMRITGDQDVRIDFTDLLKQIRGLDLNGDGTIANDGKENNYPLGANSALTNHPTDNKFEIVDAYRRDAFNDFNKASNFLGDIAFDGTGQNGDGVATNGNIFLGGLGHDTAFGGNGNDFLAGGGIAQGHGGTDVMSGVRNADFFFAEFSGIDATDGGPTLRIDGGNTSDSNSAGTTQTAQDSDWLLFEASDDDEPVMIWLNNDNSDVNDNRDAGAALTAGRLPQNLADGDGLADGMGRVLSRSGESMLIDDVENVDASGNLYGFLKNLDVQLGGRGGDSRDPAFAAGSANNGQGSSAQLQISGSNVANKIIGGFDNDYIEGRDGNDLLMGGNLKSYLANGTTIAQQLINPNLLTIVNDGRDELIGGAGSDNIVFEADAGIIEGGSTIDVDDGEPDTLWLTSMSLGTSTAAVMATDGILRFDLGVGKAGGLANFSGYGGADVNASSYTADQTKYAGAGRVQVQDMESVIATGLGAIDFAAAGSNSPELVFDNQQNFQRFTTSLDLRGTTGVNTLYSSNGTDVLEGRGGNDKLSGGEGDDDFVFFLQDSTGDGVDVIHRQADANGDNLWDGYNAVTGTGGTLVQDFGQVSAAITANSKLTLTLTDSANPTSLTGFPVNGVVISLGGVIYTVSLTSGVQSSYVAFTAGLNAALDANPALAGLDAVLNANNTITITDPAGKAFATPLGTGYTWVGNVTPPAGTLTWATTVGDPTSTQTQDRLIYRSYEDRADGETVDDEATTGSIISLGNDAYAEDLVISFQADGTRLAEDQSYALLFTNLTTQDIVTTTVNGVTYKLQVGVDLDGNSIAAEDGVGDTQAAIQIAFLTRYTAFINTFMDNDSAAGQVGAAFDGASTITLTQVTYNGEQTVFMVTPTVSIQNLSNGEPATATVTNVSQHEVHLLNYDARNLDGAGKNFDTNNVLFVGDTNVNQALLQTANNLTGGTITGTTADLVDSGVNDLAGIAQNTAPNAPLMLLNFSVHGDDFLIGGAGADVINGQTGDDRVHGSRGVDTMDGGKNYYAVQVLGEAEARVLTWNVWEAANPASAQSLLADPTLAGKVISSITLINQNEGGSALVSGVFDDTLQYNQGDFNTGATRFTVTLDNYTVSGGVVSLNNGGAGHVTVDLTGDGATPDDSTSAFSNFENVRTVSGTGLAVAGVGGGQGNDTLNVAALSTATGGIEYDLTNRADAANPVGAGKVTYSANAHASLTRPAETDFESLVMKVDGVENVIAGLGDDLLVIDETEAAKDNSFSADLGDDRIEYQNIFDATTAATDKVAQPTVTIKVNTAADQDKVEMTSGRVGTVVATDTLNSVEFITLAGNTATSSRENDVLDVRAMTTGAVVSYVAAPGAVANSGFVADLAGVTQVTVENLYQVEKVLADGDDTVIVASSAVMNLNTRRDTGDDMGTSTPAGVSKDLTFATFLDFDDLTSANARMAFTSLAGGTGTGNGQIENWINASEFTFDLGTVGSDTVDYSKSVDAIAARVELDTAQANQYVLVDSSAGAFDGTIADGDRVDVLTSVEKIVASQAESVLDMTSSTKGLEIKFGSAAAQSAGDIAADRNTYNVQISDLSSSVPLTRSYVEYRDANLNASTAIPVLATATWNRIEGSDNAEKVILNSAHSMDTDAFNLRGGANEVKYNELTKSITLSLAVTDFVAATPLTTGKVTGTVTFQDGTGAGVTGPTIAGSGTHTITSYTANNGIATGSLRIAASQDAEDNLALAGLDEKVFLVSEVGTVDNQITVKLGSGTAQNSVVLTGFELVSDAASNDVYDFGSLTNAAAGLNFIDNAANDHDTVKVDNTAVGFDGTEALGGVSGATTGDPVLAGATEISLGAIRDNGALAIAGYDFDVLDVSKVTDLTVTTVTGANFGGAEFNTDEVVFGKINNVTSALLFEAVVLTEATIGENGTTYVLNATGNSLTAGAKSVALTAGANTLSFGGTVLEQTTPGVTLRAATALNATSAVTVTTTDTGAEGVSITGGNGNDSLTGAAGADTLRGNSGNDTLNGNFVPEAVEVHTYTLSGVAFGDADQTVAINGVTIGETANVHGVVVANDDADAMGAAFVRVWANGADADGNGAGGSTGTFTASASISSVTYDATTNALTFTFTSAAGDVADALLGAGANSTAISVSAETVTTAYAARAESLDTYVFETTAALNGVDTINNFNSIAAGTNDVLNVAAFLGTAPTVDLTATDFAATGLSLLAEGAGAAMGAGVVFNKGTLAAGDISTAAAAGKIAVLDNDKAVVMVTADVDGVSDATANAYNVYFIEDTDTTGTQTWVVTLVGTVNSVIASGAEAGAIALALENPYA